MHLELWCQNNDLCPLSMRKQLAIELEDICQKLSNKDYKIFINLKNSLMITEYAVLHHMRHTSVILTHGFAKTLLCIKGHFFQLFANVLESCSGIYHLTLDTQGRW